MLFFYVCDRCGKVCEYVEKYVNMWKSGGITLYRCYFFMFVIDVGKWWNNII